MIKKRYRWQDPGAIDSLELILRQNQLIVGTSDTVPGLLAPLTLAGFEALNHIKGRSQKPYLIIVGTRKHLHDYCQFPLASQVEVLVSHCWPGPLTLILPSKPGIPPFLAPEGAIALRVPDHRGLLLLLERMGGLFSTSANLTGCPVPDTLDQVDVSIMLHVASSVSDEGKGTAVPSTILDCTGPQIKLVREGAYSLMTLRNLVDL